MTQPLEVTSGSSEEPQDAVLQAVDPADEAVEVLARPIASGGDGGVPDVGVVPVPVRADAVVAGAAVHVVGVAVAVTAVGGGRAAAHVVGVAVAVTLVGGGRTAAHVVG